MKFTLEVDLDTVTGDHTAELGRILRYWAGNLKHYDLSTAVSEQVSDSSYAIVGQWQVS